MHCPPRRSVRIRSLLSSSFSAVVSTSLATPPREQHVQHPGDSMDQNQMQRHAHADNGYDEGGVPPASAHAQQAAAGLGKSHEQQHADHGDVNGGVPAASARAQQAAVLGKKHEEQQQQPGSSLNPTAARLLREAIVSQPAAVSGSSDILAFARAVDRVDSPLE